MNLSKEDADLFFALMWPLQFFVNQRLQVVPDVDTLQAYVACPSEVKLQVRDALYENTDFIDAFVQENPNGFSDDKLAIIAKWKHFVAGDFHIERLLKKYAIFISGDSKVYAVTAISNPFQEMFHPSRLPVLVKAILLPFKDKIIYDGLLQGYNVYFGGGISGGLKETYMAAKQNGRIIETLDPDLQSVEARRPQKPAKDWRPELKILMARARKLRSGSDQPPVLSPAFALVKASLALAQSAVENPDDLDALWEYLHKASLAVGRAETTLHRAERYR